MSAKTAACSCGCGRRFVPKSFKHRFACDECWRRAHIERVKAYNREEYGDRWTPVPVTERSLCSAYGYGLLHKAVR